MSGGAPRWFRFAVIAAFVVPIVAWMASVGWNVKRVLDQRDVTNAAYVSWDKTSDGFEMASLTPLEALQPLIDTCDGKLAPGTLVSMVAPSPAAAQITLLSDRSHTTLMKQLGQDEKNNLEHSYWGLGPDNDAVRGDGNMGDHPWKTTDPIMLARGFAVSTPWTWPDTVKLEARRGPDVVHAKHMAVVIVLKATTPGALEVSGDPHDPGSADLLVVMLNAQDKSEECRGKVHIVGPPIVDKPTSPDGRQRMVLGFMGTIASAPLRLLCDAVDDRLCRALDKARPGFDLAPGVDNASRSLDFGR